MLRPLIPLFMIGFTVYIDVWLHNNPRDIIFESQPFVIKMFIKTYRTWNELVTVNRYNFHICVYNIFHKPQPLCERILGSISYWYTRPPWFLKTIIKNINQNFVSLAVIIMLKVNIMYSIEFSKLFSIGMWRKLKMKFFVMCQYLISASNTLSVKNIDLVFYFVTFEDFSLVFDTLLDYQTFLFLGLLSCSKR